MSTDQTYVSNILKAFQSMDIDFLRKHLKEEYSYQNAPKQVFLNRIEAIFEAHKTSGDNLLIVLGGSCQSSDCLNCSKKGYRFIGDISHNYFDYIFEIEDDIIKDIFTCGEFETEEESGKLGVCAEIDINEDDLATFTRTPEYWNKLEEALSAFDELICDPPRVVSLEDCNYWIKKHSVLNDSLGGRDMFSPSMQWDKFTRLYEEIKDWCNFLITELNLINEAISLYNDNLTEEELIAWIIQYEALFERVPHCLKYYLKKEQGYYKTDLITPLFVKGEEFESVASFAPVFFEHHCDLMEKYRIHSMNETNEVYSKFGFQNEVENLSSLKFHLKARENMKALGIDLQLFPDKAK